MKPTTIEFSFDDTKLEAINIFFNEKGMTLEGELERFMDTIYKKHVPQPVREFIEKKEVVGTKASFPQRSTRKKPNNDRDAVLGEEANGGRATRPNDEKPV